MFIIIRYVGVVAQADKTINRCYSLVVGKAKVVSVQPHNPAINE